MVDRCVEEMTDMGFHNNRSNGTVDSLAVGRCEDISQVDFTSVGVLLTGIILARYMSLVLTVYSVRRNWFLGFIRGCYLWNFGTGWGENNRVPVFVLCIQVVKGVGLGSGINSKIRSRIPNKSFRIKKNYHTYQYTNFSR